MPGLFAPMLMKDNTKLFYLLLFILALAVNFAGLSNGFITDDAALYASIAKNLVHKNEVWELFTYNRDWLDKPHFPFWMVFCSFKLFGISEWAYRLPALLFFLLGVVYTWLFAKKFYGKETAAIAVLILITALNAILGNTDVRAEPYLMGLIIGSIYHIASLNDRFKFKHLFFGALLTAFAIMTKGIFVITAIYGALLGQLIFKNRLKSLFQWKWLLLFTLTFIFTLPEFYALYTQFDLHPEKIVFGRDHVSGIKWFLWDSQFGRFANTGPINRKTTGSIFFYLHTLLWAFAPWCLLFYFAVYANLKAVYKKIMLPEYYIISGGLLLLLLFSLSGFQLPFYTNAIFPLFAIITAPVCYGVLNKFGNKFRFTVQWLSIILLPVLVIIINMLLKPADNFFILTDILLSGITACLVFIKVKGLQKKVFFLSCLSALFAGFYVNTVLYREIIPYKGQKTAAGYINQKQFSGFGLYVLTAENNIFQFYCSRPVGLVPIERFNTFNSGSKAVFFVNRQSMEQLVKNHARFNIMRTFANYPQENISIDFINQKTRLKRLSEVYLITRD